MRKTRIGIQLATAVEEPLLGRLGERCFAQRKFRGKRALVDWRGNYPYLVSSYGNTINCMGHIEMQLQRLFSNGCDRHQFDGELYVHGWTQQKLNGVTGRKESNPHPDRYQIDFVIYDIKCNAPQGERLAMLSQLIKHAPRSVASKTLNIVLAKTSTIITKDYLYWCSKFLKEGYEGIILRACNAGYQPAPYRTRDMLKYKPSQRDTYTIVGWKEGGLRLKGSFGAFLVIAGPGEEPFYVGTGPALTDVKRKWFWQNRHSLLGQRLIVKHEPMTTEKGIPICTSAIKLEVV